MRTPSIAGDDVDRHGSLRQAQGRLFDSHFVFSFADDKVPL